MGFLDSLKSGIGKTLGICVGVIIILFILIMLIGSSGGGSKSTTQTQTTLHQFNEEFNVESLLVVVKNLERSESVEDGYTGEKARSGAEYVIFDISIKNNGKTPEIFYNGNMKVFDSEEREFNVAGGIDNDGRRITNRDIQPGLTADYKRFYVEVPKDANGLVLEIYENGVWKTGRQGGDNEII